LRSTSSTSSRAHARHTALPDHSDGTACEDRAVNLSDIDAQLGVLRDAYQELRKETQHDDLSDGTPGGAA